VIHELLRVLEENRLMTPKRSRKPLMVQNTNTNKKRNKTKNFFKFFFVFVFLNVFVIHELLRVLEENRVHDPQGLQDPGWFKIQTQTKKKKQKKKKFKTFFRFCFFLFVFVFHDT
jgi:F0F1-type ATP synthase membrane subunit a